MAYIFALLYVVVYVFYILMILRLVFDWVEMLSRNWRPKGIFLVVASLVYAVTDPPMNFLRDKIPPLRLGGISLDLGFLILIILVSFLANLLSNLALR